MLRWHDRTFAELTTNELYAITQLRERVFIVEQNCVYLDADGVDLLSRHLWADEAGALRAYLRIVPAGVKYAELAIGRVIIAPEARGTGLGKELMKRGIEAAGGVPIRLSAQAHLQKFYRDLGFVAASEPYDEDGIMHLEMTRA
jgi:ElaA protein